MSKRDFIECRLDLLDAKNVRYCDERHIDLTYQAVVDTDQLRMATTEWLTGLVKTQGDSLSGEGLKLLGRHLYEKVFRGDVDKTFRSTFETFIKQAKEGKVAGLRLVIVFHAEAESLTNLPWEFLYLATGNQGEGTFLTGEKHSLVLTRVVPDHPRFPDVPCQSLRVLFATSTPPGSNIGSTEKLQALFKEQKTPDVRRLRDPTYSGLQAEIKNFKPDILHFVGHGEPGRLEMRREQERIEADEAAYLVQKSERRNPAPVKQIESIDVTKVRELFGPTPPRLVFLQTCHSAAVDPEVLYSTAVQIVKSGVPAVIAMQYDIGAEEADVFATEVYQRLIEGETIGQAVWAGRRRLAVRENRAWDHRDFGTPVIYVDQDCEVMVAPERERRNDDKKPQPMRRRCTRCETMASYDNCPHCRYPLYCPCPGPHVPPGPCRAVLELPNGYCGKCDHDFPIPRDARLNAKTVPKLTAPTGTLRSEQHEHEQAS